MAALRTALHERKFSYAAAETLFVRKSNRRGPLISGTDRDAGSLPSFVFGTDRSRRSRIKSQIAARYLERTQPASRSDCCNCGLFFLASSNYGRLRMGSNQRFDFSRGAFLFRAGNRSLCYAFEI